MASGQTYEFSYSSVTKTIPKSAARNWLGNGAAELDRTGLGSMGTINFNFLPFRGTGSIECWVQTLAHELNTKLPPSRTGLCENREGARLGAFATGPD